MHLMATYSLTEAARSTSQFFTSTAMSFLSNPYFPKGRGPGAAWLEAWIEVTERSLHKMSIKPKWDIPSLSGVGGKKHTVTPKLILEKPFGNLLHFDVSGRKAPKRKILLIAPMSGHYATLLRKTVISLLPDADVFITDWHNARDIPVEEGDFDIEDYTFYVADFIRHLGSDINVIAVCQPAPLALAATAYLAKENPKIQPRTLTLIGGPIDPSAAPTDVTNFGDRVSIISLQNSMIQRVSLNYPGAGRKVYPGTVQLASFISMNFETHAKAFKDQIKRVADGEASDDDRHNKFYDEYLAVMDMPAEFYLSTVHRIFKNGEIASNGFTLDDRSIDFGDITDCAVMTVEGTKDDITAPGQCSAALDLCGGLPASKKASHIEDGAGHYGIFAGSGWRDNIRPKILDFIDAN